MEKPFRITTDESVFRKYGDITVVDAFSKNVEKGLSKIENEIIKKYFKPESFILDIGCGAGREAIALAKAGFRVEGIDAVPLMAFRAKENAKLAGVIGKTRFNVFDATELYYEDETFDYVLALNEVIEHIPSCEDRVKCLSEGKRVLKKDGILVFSTHSRHSKLKYKIYWLVMKILQKLNLRKLAEGDRYCARVGNIRSGGKVFFHIYTFSEALKDIKKAGLKLINYYCVDSEGEKTNISKAYHVYYVTRKQI